jgi:peptidoglycan L-alanyl-D-glutamate endopeptidase CwlK
MDGVHPLLVACVALALRKYSEIDFGVGKGAVRTKVEQAVFVADGKSETMNSKHLPQDDYYSHAVDLYPSGTRDIMNQRKHVEIKWALDKAAEELGIELEHGYDWGWDFPHHQIKKIL